MKAKKSKLSVDRVSWRGMLMGVPHRNAAATIQTGADGTVTVTVRLHRPRWLRPPLSWILKPAGHKTVALDPIGTNVWTWCDGRRTVEQVTDEFARRYGFTFHEARVAVTGFLRTLVQRGVLAMEIDKRA